MDHIPQRPKIPPYPVRIDSRIYPNRSAAQAAVRRDRSVLKISLALVAAVVVFASAVFVSRAIQLSNKVFVGQKTTFFQKIKGVIAGSSIKLTGEDLGQVNILLLGMGGEGHDGPYLTDTMILAQIRPDLGEITLTHIPRDYLVSLPGNLGDRKINAAFAEGYYKTRDWDTAGKWARQTVETMSGLTIPYFAVVDFSGFETAIDKVGGIDVRIDRTFTDYKYPDKKNGYLPPVTFKEGEEHMSGERALIFSRSRHAAGPEGSDFARGQRQQKVIDAFKAKAFSLNLVTDAGKINDLVTVFADHFHTNMSPGEMFRVYTLVREKNMQTATLSLDPETRLVCPLILESNGAYVLTPCPGKSEEDIKAYFKSSFQLTKLTQEESVVWLATSTGDKAAYQTAYRKLTNAGLTVFELSYSKDNLPETVYFQNNPKPATAEYIKKTLEAVEATEPPPGVRIPKDRVDVVVILGTNAKAESAPKPYVQPPARKPTTSTSTLQTATSTPSAATTTPSRSTSTPTSSSTPIRH